MKHILQATEDITRYYGDVAIEAKAGDTKEYSAREAEIALSTGKFKFVETKAESKAEESNLESGQTDLEVQKAELMKLGKEELTTKAKDLDGYKSSMNKEQLVDLIQTPRAPQSIPPPAQTDTPDEGENTGE